MKFSLVFLFLASSLTSVLSNPVPGSPVQRRQTTTTSAIATLTSGATVPTVTSVSGCTDISLPVTDNDITDGSACKNFTLIFARGTGESGNIGSLVGPPFVAALTDLLGSDQVAVQGVNNYDASVAGFLEGGDPAGSTDMATLIEQTLTQCPDTKLCVSGYSQGCQVAHNAANEISTAATAFINSVVLFGDPDDGDAFGSVPASKVSTDCHTGDDICLHGDLVLPPHLTYCEDAGTEAAFAVGLSGLS